MHGLKAHTVARLGADIVTACHGAVVVQHAGGPHAAALAVTAGLVVDNVGGVEAAAGNAHGVAAAAADAVVIELTPHLKGVNVLHEAAVSDLGDIDLALILGDKRGGKVAGSLTAEDVCKGLVLHLDEHAIVVDAQGHGIIIRHIAAHRHAEAGLEALGALHEEELHLLAEALIVVVGVTAVLHKDGVEAVDAVNVAGAQENDGGLVVHLTLPNIVLGEVEQGLHDGVEHLFGGEVGLLVPHHLLHALHLAVADELAALDGCIDAVGLTESGENLVHSLLRHCISHIRTPFMLSAGDPAPASRTRGSAWQDRDRNRWRHTLPYPR